MLINVLIEELPREVLVVKLKEFVGEHIELPIESLSSLVIRRWLIEKLGGKCVKCGAGNELEVHHTLGGGTILRGLHGQKGEFIRIAKEWDNGKYCLVCYRCHPSLEPQAFRKLSAKNQWVCDKLNERMKKERKRLFDGSPGCAAREQESYFKYQILGKRAKEKYDCVRIVKELYGIPG